ncbi:MAG: hypothetical protein JW709_06840 [Sedimentisphaerales bacterium]|nr:hypothetical protein [Sedimentisphaerales bacterium]
MLCHKNRFWGAFIVFGLMLSCGTAAQADISAVQNSGFEQPAIGGAFYPSDADPFPNWTAFGDTWADLNPGSTDYRYPAVAIAEEYLWGQIPEDPDGVYWLNLAIDDNHSSGIQSDGGVYQDLGTTIVGDPYLVTAILRTNTSTIPVCPFVLSLRNADTDEELASITNADVPELPENGDSGPEIPVSFVWTADAAINLRVQIEVLADVKTTWSRLNIDDIQVINASIYAHDPVPADGAVDVPREQVLSWTTGEEPVGTTNPNITGHNVYLGTGSDPNDLILQTPTPLPVGTTSFDPTPDLSSDTTYYWRVDEVLSGGGALTGIVWSFSTVKMLPQITGQPADTMVPQGDDAYFTVTATDPLSGTLYYQWFEDPTPGAPGDEVLLSNGADYDGVATATLTVKDAQTGDISFYYCNVTNADGTVSSNAAALELPRVVYYWPFENNPDEAGGAFTGTAVGDPTYDTGMVGQAANFDGNDAFTYVNVPLAFGATDGQPATSGAASVSFWAKSSDVTKAWAGFLAKPYVFDLGQYAIAGDLFIARQTAIWTLFNGASGVLVNDAWVHLAVTHDGAGLKLYADGELAGVHDAPWPFTDAAGTFVVGAGWSYNPSSGGEMIVGMVDELRIRNYAMTANEVLMEYADDAGVSVCLESLSNIVEDGSCTTDLVDFAVFAQEWLEDNTYTPAP